MSARHRLASAVIRLYPPALRAAFGAEMRDLLETRVHAASGFAGIGRVWLATTLDLLRSWAGTWREAMAGGPPSFGRWSTYVRQAWQAVRRRPVLSIAATAG
jgi:hypothetical protein